MPQPGYVRRHNEDWQRWYQRQRKRGLVDMRKSDDRDDDDGRVSADDLSEDDIDSINQDIDARNGGSGSNESRHIEHLSTMISNAQGISPEQALGWLLHTADGLALVRRTLGKRFLKQHKEKSVMTDVSGELVSIAKAHNGAGIYTIAEKTMEAINKNQKPLVADGVQWTNLVAAAAKAAGVSFEKLYSEPAIWQVDKALTDDPFSYMKSAVVPGETRDLEAGPAVRTAPSVVGGEERGARRGSSPARRPASQEPDIGSTGTKAIDELDKLVKEQLKQRKLDASHYARVFSELYTSPTYAALAEQERRENRPAGVERMAT